MADSWDAGRGSGLATALRVGFARTRLEIGANEVITVGLMVRAASSALGLLIVACSLTQNIGSYSSGGDAGLVDSSGCAPDQKTCDGRCVALTEPAYGCAAVACDACPSPARASAACDSTGACGVGTCNTGFQNCNNKSDDGCEAEVAVDTLHCGKCNNSCDGSSCVAEKCQPLVIAQGQSSPGEIAMDTNQIYWTNYGSGTIMRSSKDGKTSVVVADNQASVWGVAVSGNQLFWANAASTGSAWKGAIDGSIAAEKLYSSTGKMRGVASDNDYLFIAHYDSNGVVRLKLTDKTTALFPAQKPNDIALDADSAYWSNEDGSLVKVSRTAATGTTPEQLLGSLSRPRGVAVDDTYAYVIAAGNVNGADGALYRVPKNGGVAVELASSLHNPRELAVDKTNVYFTCYGDGTVQRMSKESAAGGPREVLATGQQFPLGIAVDDRYVFWINFASGSQGTVVRVIKP